MITEIEVQTYSPAGKTFPRNLICENIPIAEEDLVNNCLGQQLWDWLNEKINPDLETAEDWVDCGDYATDDIVKRNGLFYVSTADNNNSDPAKAGSEWEIAGKFTDDCANKLWEKYLRKILAYRVYFFALPFTAATPGAAGLIVQGTDDRGQRGATIGEISKMQDSVQNMVAVMLSNMKNWSGQDAQDECEWPDSPALGSCKDCETAKTIASGRQFRMRMR